jgi:hypothetical protein
MTYKIGVNNYSRKTLEYNQSENIDFDRRIILTHNFKEMLYGHKHWIHLAQ